MDIQAITQLLEQQFPNAQNIQVGSEGSHLNVLIVSELFEGLTPIKKQQKVYAALNDRIASGEIHAVNMKTLTPAQWQPE